MTILDAYFSLIVFSRSPMVSAPGPELEGSTTSDINIFVHNDASQLGLDDAKVRPTLAQAYMT